MAIPEELIEKIRSLSNLPTLPASANRLIEAVNDPDISVRNIGRIVGQDPALTAKVMRLANSSYYGLPRRVTNMEDASVVLGLRVIQTLVLSLTVFESFPGTVSRDFRRTFWRHSITAAVAAKLAAERIGIPGINPEDAFCAGLLHDIGKIAMEQFLHADLERVLAVCGQADGLTFFETENRLLGYTHVDVFEWMTGSWNLPESLYLPGRFHHAPHEAPAPGTSSAVCHLADYLAHVLERDQYSRGQGPAIPELNPQVLEMLSLSEAQKDEILHDIPEALDQLKSFIDVLEG